MKTRPVVVPAQTTADTALPAKCMYAAAIGRVGRRHMRVLSLSIIDWSRTLVRRSRRSPGDILPAWGSDSKAYVHCRRGPRFACLTSRLSGNKHSHRVLKKKKTTLRRQEQTVNRQSKKVKWNKNTISTTNVILATTLFKQKTTIRNSAGQPILNTSDWKATWDYGQKYGRIKHTFCKLVTVDNVCYETQNDLIRLHNGFVRTLLIFKWLIRKKRNRSCYLWSVVDLDSRRL